LTDHCLKSKDWAFCLQSKLVGQHAFNYLLSTELDQFTRLIWPITWTDESTPTGRAKEKNLRDQDEGKRVPRSSFASLGSVARQAYQKNN